MRRELGNTFREGLMRHGGDSSCRAVADDTAAIEGTSSTVRARERADNGADCESGLRSSRAASGLEIELIEEVGVEGGRRIRYAVSVGEEDLTDGRGGSGFITVTPVALGDNGDAIIGAGIV
jgi:hypothetical protein